MQAKKEMKAIKALSNKNKITAEEEFETGRIIDGKKEYGKRFTVQALPSTAGNVAINTNLSNITIIKLEGMLYGTTLVSNIPFMYSSQPSVYHYFNPSSSQIVIRATDDMSSYSATETIYYTKN